MCFADTRQIRVDIAEGTTTELVAEVVDAPRNGGRYYGLGDSAAGNGSSGPAPFLQVAEVNPFPTGWRVTRVVAKAKGSDAAWEGRVTLRSSLNVDVPPLDRGGFFCSLSGTNGSAYDTCESAGEWTLTEGELLSLHARSTKPRNEQQSNLTRVSGCIIIEPPAED